MPLETTAYIQTVVCIAWTVVGQRKSGSTGQPIPKTGSTGNKTHLVVLRYRQVAAATDPEERIHLMLRVPKIPINDRLLENEGRADQGLQSRLHDET
jgi:hypothetical protein